MNYPAPEARGIGKISTGVARMKCNGIRGTSTTPTKPRISLRYIRATSLPIPFQNNNNHVGCVPRTNVHGAWNAPYDILLLIWKWNEITEAAQAGWGSPLFSFTKLQACPTAFQTVG